jgi:hypothetical protein
MLHFTDKLLILAKTAAQKNYHADPEITFFEWISEEIYDFTLESCYVELNAVIGVSEREWDETTETWIVEEEEYQDRDFGLTLSLDPEHGWFVAAVEEI